MKYGALSTDIGRIRIQGRRSEGSYRIIWSERWNGPSVPIAAAAGVRLRDGDAELDRAAWWRDRTSTGAEGLVIRLDGAARENLLGDRPMRGERSQGPSSDGLGS